MLHVHGELFSFMEMLMLFGYPNIKQFLRPSNNSCKLTINDLSYRIHTNFTHVSLVSVETRGDSQKTFISVYYFLLSPAGLLPSMQCICFLLTELLTFSWNCSGLIKNQDMNNCLEGSVVKFTFWTTVTLNTVMAIYILKFPYEWWHRFLVYGENCYFVWACRQWPRNTIQIRLVKLPSTAHSFHYLLLKKKFKIVLSGNLKNTCQFHHKWLASSNTRKQHNVFQFASDKIQVDCNAI